MAPRGIRINSSFNSCIFFILLTCFWACHSSNKQPETPNAKPETFINVPSFNPDSAYIHIQKQVAFGPRIPNTTAHTKCGDYILSQLKLWCDTVIVQSAPITAYDGKVLRIKRTNEISHLQYFTIISSDRCALNNYCITQ